MSFAPYVDDDDYRPRCRRGHYMKGIVYTAQGGGDEVEWRCDYCRRLDSGSTDPDHADG